VRDGRIEEVSDNKGEHNTKTAVQQNWVLCYTANTMSNFFL